MKKIMLNLVFFVLLISCSGGAGGGNSQITQPQTGTTYTLKIRTLLYSEGALTESPADGLVEISVGEQDVLNNISSETLLEGLALPKDTLVNIMAVRVIEKDTADEGKGLLWLGYSSDAEAAKNNIIELEMNSDKELTLVVSDDKDIDVPFVIVTLEVDASKVNSDGVSEIIEGAVVKVDGSVYKNGNSSIIFVPGQKPLFEAILPTNNTDIEFTGFNVGGVIYDVLVTSDIEMKDNLSILTKFIDKKSAIFNISINGIDSTRGEIYVNSDKINPDGEEKNGTWKKEGLPVGTEVELKATAKENYTFHSWVVNGESIIENPYTYKVKKEDAEIVPSFVSEKGSLKISIDQRTNYGGYGYNRIAYEYTSSENNVGTVKSKGMGDPNGPDDLTWNNDEITEIQAGSTVKLVATTVEGFNPGDGTKVLWSGDITGQGFQKEIQMGATSKAASLKLTKESRNVKIELKRLLNDGNAWVDEDTSLDAKGYSIRLDGKDAANSKFESDTLSISKIYEWGEVIALEVDSGEHYAVNTVYAGANDYVHDNTHTEGNPTNFTYIDANGSVLEVRGGKKASVDINNRKFKMEFRVEDRGNDSITTIYLRHRAVKMSLYTSGGKLDGSLPEDDKENSGHISLVKLADTGIPGQEAGYQTKTYYESGDRPTSLPTDVNILSGVATKVNSIAKLGSVFVNYVAEPVNAITSVPTLAEGIVKYTAIGNTGIDGQYTSIKLTANFKSPIYKPWVQLIPITESSNPEAEKTRVGGYSYTRTTDRTTDGKGDAVTDNGGETSSSTGRKYTKSSTGLKVRHGVPFNIKVDAGAHYGVESIAGKNGVSELSITYTSDLGDVKILLKHVVRDVKLNIFGGRDERESNTSKVGISGTGVSSFDTTYNAAYRNISLAPASDGKLVSNQAKTYYIKALSGIEKQVEVKAITSKIHNFHKITGNTNDLGSGVDELEVIAPSDLRQGSGTYNKTTVYTVKKIQPHNDGVINVYFRLNTHHGRNNGLIYITQDPGVNGGEAKEFYDLFYDYQSGKNKPGTDEGYTQSGNIINVTSARGFFMAAARNPDFTGQEVHIMNDLYFGGDTEISSGPDLVQATLYGNANIIFDVAMDGMFIPKLERSTMSGITFSRGTMNQKGGHDHAGIIGYVTADSKALYITNAGVTIGELGKGDKIGGVVGAVVGQAELSYLGNYGNVYGRRQIGGVIGYIETDAGKNYTYLFNRGNVHGRANTDNNGARVGGVVGELGGYNTGVSRVYNAGQVQASESANASVGGIVGVMNWSRNAKKGDMFIEDFYNTGKVIGGSGIAGVVAGCREIKTAAEDNEMNTDAFFRGYNIGDFDEYASITWAGHAAGDWYQGIGLYDVYFGDLKDKSLNGGLGYATWLNSRLDGGGDAGRVSYSAASEWKANGKYKKDNGKVNDIIKDHGSLKLDNMKALKEKTDVWEQVTLPAVNGYTSRPTIKNLRESDSFPSWITNTKQ